MLTTFLFRFANLSFEDDPVMDDVESCPCEDNLDMEGVDSLAFVVDLIMESEV